MKLKTHKKIIEAAIGKIQGRRKRQKQSFKCVMIVDGKLIYDSSIQGHCQLTKRKRIYG